ncbi:GGDEF domain-containing protein [Hoeflea sp.]|uniref:GGDEF domain-containing protein n=1 Tax=Hoeflea sp. TaxID=1940281 RepID=UPI003BAEE9DB
MRFADLWNPFTIVGRGIASQQKLEETLSELFNSRPHVMAAFAICLAAVSAALSGHLAAAAAASAIAIAYLAMRIVIERRFRKNHSGGFDPGWIRSFVIGSLVSGLAWGLCGAILIHDTSPATQMITLAVLSAILQGTAGRAYMMPGTAFINIVLVMGQVGLSALLTGTHILLPAIVIYFVFLRSFILQMIDNRLRQLEAEKISARLFEEITEKNKLLRIANEALAAKAYADSLTGLANRRKFDLVIDESIAAAQEKGSDLSLLMIDVDHFKAFNDTYGHQAGDECLQRLSTAIKRLLPGDDSLLARYGGEEFVVILPGQGPSAAASIAERICVAVRLTSLESLPNSPPRQTVSIGLASLETVGEPKSHAMLAAADSALYQAKKAGRNRVCVHSGRLEQPALSR